MALETSGLRPPIFGFVNLASFDVFFYDGPILLGSDAVSLGV